MLKRRTVLQGALAGAVLSGCSTDTPVSVPTVDPGSLPLDVVAGAEYGGFAAAAYRKKYPSASVTSVVDPLLRDKVLTRFQAGGPPDVVLNAGAKPLELPRLVAQGQLADLRGVLDAPAWDNDKAKVSDGILPGMLESGQYDGTQRTINYVATVYGLWYSAALFQRHGWDVPRTWPQLLALGTEMKGAGLGAFVYPGNHPYYVLELVLTLAAKAGGHDVVKRIDNLEDGAWRDSAMIRAISAVGELVKRGLLAPGSAKYDHIAAQKRFLANKAGMLPCGNWLENEMRASIPANFALTMFAVPPLDGSTALPRGLHVAATAPYLVAEKAKNKAGGLEFLRAALSRDVAAQVTTEANQLTIVRGAADGLEIGTALRSARDLLGAAGDQAITWYFDSWYPAFATAAAQATGEFLAGGVPVSDWSGKIQLAADELKKDKAVTKYHRA
ncbi:N-acetylglucosamine/diacetylchitobiose ABC transporter substrate-binding protein [Kribbella albertanoniae]|uniref:Carbohydrate ABC transporter, N-acetylglucosamine/diacetylchitobiose-binding protein n=1 Tax=Kribbella albertanoniae TaxID=1266829 RepID=A0A4V2XS07_9ACTN|nr:N-acetylglucosamine/diacetylchitobiose ABC transporter substrate-binding protein [Kribbella albertanoniae]TDC31995.1 carbohydrate ABC transporter, N-acetylglucosamine/diacetylchitobiose-binding protein [Kribbella albertanoniae]